MTWHGHLRPQIEREFILAKKLARGVVVRESDRREIVMSEVVVEGVRPKGQRRIIERTTCRMTTALETLMRHAQPGEDAAATLERVLHERTALAGIVLDAYEARSIAPLLRIVKQEGNEVIVRIPPRDTPGTRTT